MGDIQQGYLVYSESVLALYVGLIDMEKTHY